MGFKPLLPKGVGAFRSAEVGPSPAPFLGSAPASAPPPVAVAVLEPELVPKALVEAARREGFAAGRDEGLREGKSSAEREFELERRALKTAATALAQLSHELTELRPKLYAEAAAPVAAVIEAGIAHVLGESVALHPGALGALLESALSRFARREGLRVRVPKGRAEALAGILPESLILEEDLSLLDGVVVEGPQGSVEATVDAAMEGLRAAIASWKEQYKP